MDWTSRRITAILENALQEDRATRDATTYACIDPNQRASGYHPRQAGLRALRAGLHLAHPRVSSPRWTAPSPRIPRSPATPKSSTACACAKGSRCGHRTQCARRLVLRACDLEHHAAHERHCHADPPLRGRGGGYRHHNSGHAQDCAGPACARQVRRELRRGHQPSSRPQRWRAHQEQPHCAGRRRRGCAATRAAQSSRLADRRN